MIDASIRERRRDALITAAQLQRRNIGARWRHLRQRRAVHWMQSGIDAIDALRRPLVRTAAAAPVSRRAARPWWAIGLSTVLPMLAGTRAPFVATALRVAQRPTLFSVGMLALQWVWRRRRRRVASRSKQHRRWFDFSMPKLRRPVTEWPRHALPH